ncbi:amidohydrolase [Salinirubellus salinus]|uniref:Amidohydrolase n=1 Tax=Salinirubellus salinus TaxID=1364945 RepID=A0A9E7R574_9EURY|nr:amidohydrolase [Salinirubellus salinus]UWM55434.1 amidohydrolase [Salinirubellus salinus]
MTRPADLVLTNAEVHTLAAPPDGHAGLVADAEAHDGVFEDGAVAVRDGRIVRVGTAYEVEFLEGAGTTVVDCGGRVLLPGFVDAHTHMEVVGRRLVHADLGGADSRADAVARLRVEARESDGWVQGYGYDESEWGETAYLRREELDEVSETRPVVAFREDLHTASVNGIALDILGLSADHPNVQTEDGRPTGVLTESAVEVLNEAIAPDVATTRRRVVAARDHAHELGVTAVHDMVRGGHVARVYRELDTAGSLVLRVRINYWTDHLDAVSEAGLVTNAGSEFVRTGAIKTFTDGSIGGRTAKVSKPYADAEEEGDEDGHGEWVVTPEELREWVDRAEEAGFQFTAHAIGDVAVRETLAAYRDTAAPDEARHRVEHAEILDEAHVREFAESDVVASVQPNFHRWAREGGLYESRLGARRTSGTNPLGALAEAGVPLAFGSDSMPLGPLYGVGQAVTAPAAGQRLSVTESLAAYTRGAAYAGFDEGRMGTVEAGTLADLVVLEESPWSVADEAIGDVEVWRTVVDGRVVYRA